MFLFFRSQKENGSLLLKKTDVEMKSKAEDTKQVKQKHPQKEQSVSDTNVDGEVCMLQDSPYRILKVGQPWCQVKINWNIYGRPSLMCICVGIGGILKRN